MDVFGMMLVALTRNRNAILKKKTANSTFLIHQFKEHLYCYQYRIEQCFEKHYSQ